jgi:hypothetical protein
MIHISGEKSKRGEIRFPKMGMATFISVDSKLQNGCQGRKNGGKNSNFNGLHCFKIEEGFGWNGN